MITLEQAQAQLGNFAGKTVRVRIDAKLGGIWVHEPDCDSNVRFYGDLKFVSDTVIEYYEDYLSDRGGFIDDDSEWIHPTIIPFASVGGEPGADDEMFFNDSFAFLLWDLQKGTILSATTDDWEFETIGTFDEFRTALAESA